MYIINQHGIFHSVVDSYQLRPGQREATAKEIANAMGHATEGEPGTEKEKADAEAKAKADAEAKAEITETVVVVGGKPAKPKAVKND